ncbi:hypothetical protein [Fodinicola feengrottensis]|uniref:hypothetical protein n=1 Tax=Fodinicola feengrottensis TaxID=435914 RepID=UPI0024421210|nr:hypothetical protein [Fodinicola feengrottensis]
MPIPGLAGHQQHAAPVGFDVGERAGDLLPLADAADDGSQAGPAGRCRCHRAALPPRLTAGG